MTQYSMKPSEVVTNPNLQRKAALSLAERIAAAKQQYGAADADEWTAKVAQQRANVEKVQ